MRPNLIQSSSLCTLTCLLGMGCTDPSSFPSTATVRDSAGVPIVENFLPAWGDGDAWTVDPDPVFDLSGLVDDELFRPYSPWLLGDGRTVLFNSGACEVRFYDDTGFLNASGGCGGGPGEYTQSSTIVLWPGDSLLVYDQGLRRITLLDGEGALGHTTAAPSGPDMLLPRIKGSLVDGTLILSSERYPAGRLTEGVEVAEVYIRLVSGSF